MENKTFKAVKVKDDIQDKEIDALEITTISKHTIPKEVLEKQKAEIEEKLSHFK